MEVITIILAILQARMSSTRLPGKVLKPILGEPMLFRQIERIRRSKKIDDLIVATSTSKEDDQIEKLCSEKNVRCFRGSLDDVLDRFYGAAMTCNSEYIMRLTGDCPLFDPGIADELVDFFILGGYDYVSNTVEPTYPDGLDIEIMKFSALKTAWEEAKLPSEREHVTPYILKHPEVFSVGCMKNSEDLSQMRWTVDEPEDYEFVKFIYEYLYDRNSEFTWEDVLCFIQNNPEVATINSNFRRNEGYEKSLNKDIMIN